MLYSVFRIFPSSDRWALINCQQDFENAQYSPRCGVRCTTCLVHANSHPRFFCENGNEIVCFKTVWLEYITIPMNKHKFNDILSIKSNHKQFSLWNDSSIGITYLWNINDIFAKLEYHIEMSKVFIYVDAKKRHFQLICSIGLKNREPMRIVCILLVSRKWNPSCRSRSL